MKCVPHGSKWCLACYAEMARAHDADKATIARLESALAASQAECARKTEALIRIDHFAGSKIEGGPFSEEREKTLTEICGIAQRAYLTALAPAKPAEPDPDLAAKFQPSAEDEYMCSGCGKSLSRHYGKGRCNPRCICPGDGKGSGNV